jgi:hypothetical protein
MAKAMCNNCAIEFSLKIWKRRIDPNNSDKIYEYYLKCPACKSEIISFYENNETRRNNNLIRTLQSQYSKESDCNKRIEMQDKIRDIIVKNQSLIDAMKVKYAKH